MAKVKKKFDEGIKLKPTDTAAASEGELRAGSSDQKIKTYIEGAERDVVTADQIQTLSKKIIDSANNTITIDADEATVSELKTNNFKAGVIKTDGTMTGASDTEIPTALAVKTYVDNAGNGEIDASEIVYDNTTSGLTATEVQSAMDEVEGRLDTAETGLSDHLADAVDAHDASAISYVNATSGLAATEVQAAIDEVDGDLDTHIANTAAHGATGAVMGTTNSQTVSNKTLDNSNSITIQDSNLTLQDNADNTKQVQLQLSNIDTATTRTIQFPNDDVVLVGTGTTQTLTQKTLDSSNIITVKDSLLSIVDDSDQTKIIQFDAASISTGTLRTVAIPDADTTMVGTDTTQTLTNKTITGASIQTPTRSDVKQDTEANLTTYAGSASDGQIVFATDTQKMYQVISNALEPIGGGNSVITVTASENLAIRDAVYITAAGEAAKVDVDDDAKMEFVGFAKAAATATNPVEVIISGTLDGFSSLTPGEFVYIDPTTPGAIVQPEPTQLNVYLVKAGKAISATEIIINPDLAASAEFNRDVIANTTITNNQSSPANVTGVSFDGTVYRAAILNYSIYRTTDSNEYSQVGQLKLAYKTTAATWSITDSYGGDDAGVTFSIDGTGQVQYTSTNVAGSGYSSSLKITTLELFEV